MKKILSILIILLAVFTLTPGQVFAASEAGEAGKLLSLAKVAQTDTRAAKLRAFLESYNSPLAGDAETFVAEADRNNLDWKLVAAIAGAESTFGKAIPTGSYNGWGWGVFTGANDGVHFSDWAHGIATVSEGLRTNYIDRGATTIYEMGWIYAANGNSWASHVRYFVDKIETFQPATIDSLSVSI